MKDRWTKLLSDSRVQSSSPQSTSAFDKRSPFEADYDRVIYSTPFRRLARKTQVHPLALNDHVRTRLTHSLEVSCVGRSLATRLGSFLKQKDHLPDSRTSSDLSWIMLAACCSHDIGNPPFGHAGEFAIREWTKVHMDIVFPEEHECTDDVRDDVMRFEGNAQGFRIAARKDNEKTGYIRLTYAALGAMIKYPWRSNDDRADRGNDKWKFNVFSTEAEIFDQMWSEMGLVSCGQTYRHPLSFLTEAADDICYRILDLEDAVELDLLPASRVKDLYAKIAGTSASGATELQVLRGKAIAALIDGVWKVFESRYEDVMTGQTTDCLQDGLTGDLDEAIKTISGMHQEIFAERTKVAAELGAYKAIGRIIKALCEACKVLADKKNYEDSGFLARRSVDLTWGKDYAIKNQDKPYQWWLYQVFDYISGLTDNLARQLSREIEGT